MTENKVEHLLPVQNEIGETPITNLPLSSILKQTLRRFAATTLWSIDRDVFWSEQ